MKRNTPEHWKMSNLAKMLGVCLAQAVGHMEMLFHLTAKQAIHGNIGKMPNHFIAERCGWEGDADLFIEALIDTKWLDRCVHERLIVHDWNEHCDDATRKAVQRSKRPFCIPNQTTADNGGQSPPTSDNGVLPSLAKPSLAMPTEGVCDFPEEVIKKAVVVYDLYGKRRWGKLWKGDYATEQSQRDLREICGRLIAFPAAEKKLVGYFANPPNGRSISEKLWHVFQYLELETKQNHKPERPTPVYKDFTAERLAGVTK